jgi:hypothetical protein
VVEVETYRALQQLLATRTQELVVAVVAITQLTELLADQD